MAEIEKQFTRLEAGVAGLRRVQANLKRYRAAVLKAACEGKLVPTEAELARQEGRTYETGAQLLERILTERRQKWNGKGKYKEPAEAGHSRICHNCRMVGRGRVLTTQLPFGGLRDWSQFTENGADILYLAQNVRPMYTRFDMNGNCSMLRKLTLKRSVLAYS